MGWLKKIAKPFKKAFKWVERKIVRPIVKGIGKVGSFLVDVVTAPFGGMFNAPDLGSVSAASANNEGILLNKTGTVHNIPVVYGQRKVGGTIVFMSTDGSRNENLYMAVVLSEGRVQSIDPEKIFIDGVVQSDSRFLGYKTIIGMFGEDNQTASPLLKEAPGWTDDHRLRGVSFLACKFVMPEVTTQEQSDKMPWQGMPQIQAIIKGKMIASAATAGASDYETETNDLSNVASSNPADVILDFLRNPRYGVGLSNDRIDFASFAAARNIYNTRVTYADGGEGYLHQINAVINTGETLLNNLKKLLVHCRSALPYVQGKFKLIPLDSGSTTSPVDPTPTPVFDIEPEHIVDGIGIIDQGIRNQANQVRVAYIDPNAGGDTKGEDWSVNEVIYPTTGSARDLEMLAEDGNKRVIREYNLEYCTNSSQAAYHAKLLCENERRIKTLSVTCTPELHEVEVGDIIRLYYPRLGINYAFYRVMGTEIKPDYSVELALREHQPATYTFTPGDSTLGTKKQRQYVGDTQRVPTYIYNHQTGEWELSTKPFDPNNPSFPDTGIQNISITDLRIDGVSSTGFYDSPSFPIQTLEFTVHIEDYLLGGIQVANITKFNRATQSYEPLTSMNLGVNRTSSETYKTKVNIDMNGENATYRVFLYMRNGNIFKSAGFTFQTATSIYRNVITAAI